MNIIRLARVRLISIGKFLPFVICSFVALSYIESLFALACNNYILYDSYAVLDKPISFFIGRYFEYNVQMLAVLVIISFAVETCVYNKLACLYLGINLIEKSYFDFELEPTTIYIICAANILVSGYLTYKGIRILLK